MDRLFHFISLRPKPMPMTPHRTQTPSGHHAHERTHACLSVCVHMWLCVCLPVYLYMCPDVWKPVVFSCFPVFPYARVSVCPCLHIYTLKPNIFGRKDFRRKYSGENISARSFPPKLSGFNVVRKKLIFPCCNMNELN